MNEFTEAGEMGANRRKPFEPTMKITNCAPQCNQCPPCPPCPKPPPCPKRPECCENYETREYHENYERIGCYERKESYECHESNGERKKYPYDKECDHYDHKQEPND